MGREEESEGEKLWCVRDTLTGCLSHTPNQGPGPQLRHVPWLGIKPPTLWFAGQRSIHWATPVRVRACYFLSTYLGQTCFQVLFIYKISVTLNVTTWGRHPSALHWWADWSAAWLSKLPKAVQLFNGRARIQTQTVQFWSRHSQLSCQTAVIT